MNELPLNGFMFVKMKMDANKQNLIFSDRLSFGVYDKKITVVGLMENLTLIVCIIRFNFVASF